MKKLLSLTLVLCMVFSALPIFAQSAVKVELDGVLIDCRDVNGNKVDPILQNGTTYLPVRAVADALNLDIIWDDASKSVFINGSPEKAEKSDYVNIYINSTKFIAKDISGNIVNPILQNGTTYLPVRAVGEAFDKRVSWDDTTKTASLTTPSFMLDFDSAKTYAIISKANNKAITITDSALVTAAFSSVKSQGFTFTKTDTDGYYYINSLSNGKNFDVNGNSKNPGGTIITYNAGTADNQKFAVEHVDNGYVIYSKSSKLPIEDSADKIKQNVRRDSVVQVWDIVEFTPDEAEVNTVYRTLNIGNLSLSESSELTAASSVDDSSLWLLTPNTNGEYTITNKISGKSLDVANNSKTSGDPIITYKTSNDANQRWLFLRQEDGTYLIQSVHSSLYLTISDNNIIQSEFDQGAKQNWTIKIK